MTVRHPNSIVDLIAAAHRLNVDDSSTLGRIAGLLGLDVAELLVAHEVTPSRAAAGDFVPPVFAPAASQDRDKSDAQPDEDRPPFDPLDDAWIEPLPGERPSVADIHASVEPFPADDSGFSPAPPRVPSLFQPQWTRALLEAALGTTSPRGDVDVEAVVEILSRRGVVSSLPRLPVTELSRGVQLLCDTGDSMQPFLHDVWSTVQAIERLLVPELIDILVFNGTPLAGVGTVGDCPLGQYRLPRPGTPVVVLSDFGAGWRPPLSAFGPVEDWLRFAETLKRGGCPLLGFCPYESARIPRKLRGVLVIIPWDRHTTTAQVLRSKSSRSGANR
ncbi:MAG: hypothetical protein KJ000_23615 [Pirellulaceae bacterium]|nr:hypothetical protein [Pirellulaceae bacterium]